MGFLALGIVVAVALQEELPVALGGWNSFEFDLEVAPKSVPAGREHYHTNGSGKSASTPVGRCEDSGGGGMGQEECTRLE